MKTLKIVLIIVASLSFAANVFAATSVTQTANVTIASVLSIEFASTTDSTFGSSVINWGSVDPTIGNLIPPASHSVTKPDVGIICKYNGSQAAWYLKMSYTSSFLAGKVKFYMGQPVDRNTGSFTNGMLAFPTPVVGQDWPVIPAIATTVYSSGSTDTNNVPLGTFCGINFALNPEGVNSGARSGTITYTITTTP